MGGGGLPGIPEMDLRGNPLKRQEEFSRNPIQFTRDNPGGLLAANPLVSAFSKTKDEVAAENAALMGNIKAPPALPTDDDARILEAQRAALEKQNARKGRAASIKTSAGGLGTQAPIAKASLLG